MLAQTFASALATIEDEGQRDELAEFYAKNFDRFIYIALSRTNNRHDAEDAVQNAFIDITDKPERFFALPPHKRIAYVNVMIRNNTVDLYRRRNRVVFFEENENNVDESAVSLEDDVLERLSRSELLAFVEGLPLYQQNVLVCNRLLGFSIEETAKHLNISLSAAKKHLYRARKAIREFVREREESNERNDLM
ncbi:MAG: sigma-70 family RNA polymerase sigma factor [Bacteroides sp.]|nr:sigma-70 family RNA polymerase sigma factor [Eubacterium sp.]MCM1418678.1 sigma-70 family RNA polymerase sigma factor [Roseburia sp.]MCM1461982.1 sigma-70 family RNA polymerase sigma factor [Bacteroides sp.]